MWLLTVVGKVSSAAGAECINFQCSDKSLYIVPGWPERHASCASIGNSPTCATVFHPLFTMINIILSAKCTPKHGNAYNQVHESWNNPTLVNLS